MENDRHLWRAWADFLQRWGMKEWAASLLEAAGPLSLLAVQVIYMSQPFLKGTALSAHGDALTRLLDDSRNTTDFVEFLREAPS